MSASKMVDPDLTKPQVRAVMYIARQTRSAAEAAHNADGRQGYWVTIRLQDYLKQWLEDNDAWQRVNDDCPCIFLHPGINLHLYVNGRRWWVVPANTAVSS